MRAHDQALPAFTLDPLDPAGDVAEWPFRPVILLENNAGVYVDVTCYWSSLFTETGPVDRRGNAPTARALITLLDPARDLARYTADLKLTDWSVGNQVIVLATNGVWTNVLFRGRLARFDDLGRDRIEVEAFDATRDLAAPIATPYTAGVTGDTIAARVAAVIALTLVDNPTQLETGTVLVTAQPSTALPVDEIRAVVQSDGGVFFVDVDGTIRSFDRRWRGGRGDQTVIHTFTDGLCDGWDFDLWDVDEWE